MARFLMTQTLLSSWAYMFNCYDGCEDDAKADFLRTLNREKVEPTKAMQDGIAFEREVYRQATGYPRTPHKDWESGIKAVATHVSGAQFQVKAQRELTVCGMDFLCYGILDGLRAGQIFDVKYKEKSFGSLDLAGSYLDSAQHPMYFYLVPEAYEFQYLVSDGTDLYIETYHPNECRSIEEIVTDFVKSITDMGLLPVYLEKWAAK